MRTQHVLIGCRGVAYILVKPSQQKEQACVTVLQYDCSVSKQKSPSQV